MIVLDTNVVSAMMRSQIDPPLAKWLSTLGAEPLGLTAVNVAELVHGFERLPVGKRRSDLVNRFEEFVGGSAPFLILPLDAASGRRAGVLAALREQLGRPVRMADMMIAGICAEHGAGLATRNVRDFQGLDLNVRDPWA